jgi:hypothetical protein
VSTRNCRRSRLARRGARASGFGLPASDITPRGSFAASTEVSRKVDQFGGIAHVFSTYEARRKADDAQLLARGINSIQLFNDGKRWWIVSVYWQAERPDSPIPAAYLPKAR